MPTLLTVQLACTQTPHPSFAEMQRWVSATLSPSQDKISLNIRLVDETEIQMLNKQYRHKDKVTDILSFPFMPPEGISGHFMGDIVLCTAKVNQDAAEQNKPYLDHWAHLCVHGTLHLLGFDHETDKEAEIMIKKEVEILHSLHIPDPWQHKESKHESS
ncbi:MAG: rRNA maturation RNase YbeY [Gammaproteobacteria bacterium]|nr:rRNA maturation RNase YbeY [Gammaproteobacteria bacterium]